MILHHNNLNLHTLTDREYTEGPRVSSNPTKITYIL